MREGAILRRNPDVVSRVIGDETILLPIYKTSEELNCIYTLNKPASRVWEMIDGKTTAGGIGKKVMKEFGSAPKEVEREMKKLLKDLKEIKAVLV
ncbi:MAG: PqqD family protein [Pseudomonadota bacterium]